jgi:hypothetical protein
MRVESLPLNQILYAPRHDQPLESTGKEFKLLYRREKRENIDLAPFIEAKNLQYKDVISFEDERLTVESMQLIPYATNVAPGTLVEIKFREREKPTLFKLAEKVEILMSGALFKCS